MKIAICAGELSGDQHISRVIRELRLIAPDAVIKGMGGRFAREAGAEITVDAEQAGGVMGFGEVLFRIREIRSALRMMKSLLEEWRPQLLIVIDYPDFNLRLAAAAKTLGIKVLYYIPPKVWAWREGRTRKIGAVSDMIAGIFPFERSFYAARKIINVRYVGHPFAGDNGIDGPPTLTRQALCDKYGLNSEDPIVLLMPGSRKREIQYHMQPLIEGMVRARESDSRIQAVIGVASSINFSEYLRETEKYPWLKVVHESSYDLMKLCDAGVLKSGTCNLEAAFLGLPFVCIYRSSPISIFIARTFIKIKEISLPNIISSGTVRELIQESCNPIRIADELLALLNPTEAKLARMRLSTVRDALMGADTDPVFGDAQTAPARAARLALSLVSSGDAA